MTVTLFTLFRTSKDGSVIGEPTYTTSEISAEGQFMSMIEDDVSDQMFVTIDEAGNLEAKYRAYRLQDEGNGKPRMTYVNLFRKKMHIGAQISF